MKRKGTSVLSPILPLLAVVMSAFIISQKSVDHVFETYPSLYIITFGMVAAKVTNKLVVSSKNSEKKNRHELTSFRRQTYNSISIIFFSPHFRLHTWPRAKWAIRITDTLDHFCCFWINISIIFCLKFMYYASP